MVYAASVHVHGCLAGVDHVLSNPNSSAMLLSRGSVCVFITAVPITTLKWARCPGPGTFNMKLTWNTWDPKVCVCVCVCLLLQYLLQSCSRGGKVIVEDMCCQIITH